MGLSLHQTATEMIERGEHLRSKGIPWDQPDATPLEDIAAQINAMLGLSDQLPPWQEELLREAARGVAYGQGVVVGTGARGEPFIYAKGGPNDPDVQRAVTSGRKRERMLGQEPWAEWLDEFAGVVHSTCPTNPRWLAFCTEAVARG